MKLKEFDLKKLTSEELQDLGTRLKNELYYRERYPRNREAFLERLGDLLTRGTFEGQPFTWQSVLPDTQDFIRVAYRDLYLDGYWNIDSFSDRINGWLKALCRYTQDNDCEYIFTCHNVGSLKRARYVFMWQVGRRR